jgi:hypothetical protein
MPASARAEARLRDDGALSVEIRREQRLVVWRARDAGVAKLGARVLLWMDGQVEVVAAALLGFGAVGVVGGWWCGDGRGRGVDCVHELDADIGLAAVAHWSLILGVVGIV